MTDKRTILVCSCEDTMPLDEAAVAKACRGATVARAHQLCRAELARFRAALAGGVPLTVGCTQEAPLFSEVAAEHPGAPPLAFANIRETAGWSDDTAGAGPKMAALLAAAAEPVPDVALVSLTSDGALLIYGRDAQALEAGALLKDHLDVTVMLTGGGDVAPPRVTDFPVVAGTIRQAKGHLGAFELVVDGYAAARPSARAALAFGMAQSDVARRCDVLLDVSGAAPLFQAHDLRDGYLRADPRDPAAVLRAVLKARELIGTFDKPRYVTFTDALCAHSRSRIVGCRRCLDLCPTGAITPAGDHVAINAAVCAGCGQCAAACPTGAAAYALPPVDALLGKLRTLLLAYREAGGASPIVLLHDASHGTELIDALARFGDGLPAAVLPLAVNEVTQIGLEAIAAAFAYGAAAVRLLVRARPRHDVAGLGQTIALADAILAGLGFGPDRVATIETDDPDALGAALRGLAPAAAPAVSSFVPLGAKRGLQRLALRELQRVAPAPVDVIALPADAPFGAVEIDVAGCTLCLACVAACPTGALSDDPDRPMLRFTEEACVQCGLCKATCPEKVISLRPQLDLRGEAASARVLKQEEPFPCIRCGKPFGVRSTIERVTAKLAGRHWMYQGVASRLDLVRMCEDCRVIVASEQDLDPYAAPRPTVRTTEDYLRERADKPKDGGSKS
jgi:ferredoxin